MQTMFHELTTAIQQAGYTLNPNATEFLMTGDLHDHTIDFSVGANQPDTHDAIQKQKITILGTSLSLIVPNLVMPTCGILLSKYQ